jgi:phospholipid/cholesterol/gamma-HCH transport system permease protein
MRAISPIPPRRIRAKGVSLATTAAVVLSCVTILVADYVLTSFLL